MAGIAVPAIVDFERGQVVDAVSDYIQYLHGKRWPWPAIRTSFCPWWSSF
jgi:hypothetical protein